jgi:hypothetical protein
MPDCAAVLAAVLGRERWLLPGVTIALFWTLASWGLQRFFAPQPRTVSRAIGKPVRGTHGAQAEVEKWQVPPCLPMMGTRRPTGGRRAAGRRDCRHGRLATGP